jgi:hypothetical protein
MKQNKIEKGEKFNKNEIVVINPGSPIESKVKVISQTNFNLFTKVQSVNNPNSKWITLTANLAKIIPNG